MGARALYKSLLDIRECQADRQTGQSPAFLRELSQRKCLKSTRFFPTKLVQSDRFPKTLRTSAFKKVER